MRMRYARPALSERARLAAMLDPSGIVWQQDPVTWAAKRAGLELWSGQRRILQSVADNPRTAVQSCHEIGKSFSAAAVVCWWLDTHDPGDAFVLTTAPTGDQVKAILWREINKLHSRVGLPGRVNLTEWYIGNELVAIGRKPNEQNPTAMQGTHARYFLAVLDEACGIPKSLWDAASTLTANQHGRILAIGNPDDSATEFGNVCLKSPDWNVIKIGAKDTPNFTGEDVSNSLSEMLISKEWYENRATAWGAESALFSSKCDGEFAVGMDPYAVIPLHMVALAQNTDMVPDHNDVCAGIDVGAGGDRTIIQERRGMVAGRQEVFVDADPMRTVGRLVRVLNEWGVRSANVDNIGIGWALTGRLKELSSVNNPSGDRAHHASIAGVNFGSPPTPGTEKQFLNKRAEVWWNVGRENCRLRRWDITSVSASCIEELTTPRYEILDSHGKIKVEPKDDVIKRIGHSPDEADALLLAFTRTRFVMELPATDMSKVNLLEGINPRGYGTFDALR